MPNEHRTFDVKRLHHRDHIIAQAICRIITLGWGRMAGCAKSSARNAIDVILFCELRSKTVETMRGVSRTCQENERLASASPIQHLKANPWLDRHKLHSMRGAVDRLLRKQPTPTYRPKSHDPWSRISHRYSSITIVLVY